MYIYIIIALICLIIAIFCYIANRNKAALMSLVGVIASVIGVLATVIGDTGGPEPTPSPATTPPAISDTLPPTPTPTPTPTPKPATHEDEMADGDARVVYPDESSWLSEIESKYVRSEKGNCIILRWRLDEHFDYSGDNLLMRVPEGTLVEVLARQDGFSLIKVQDGVVGWVPSRLLGDS